MEISWAVVETRGSFFCIKNTPSVASATSPPKLGGYREGVDYSSPSLVNSQDSHLILSLAA